MTWTSRSTGSGPLYVSRNRAQVRLSLLLFVHRSHVDLHTDKFKEENWNLEVTLQELHTQLSDSQADTLWLEAKHKQLSRLLSASRDAGEQKNEAKCLKLSLEEVMSKHETEQTCRWPSA